MDHCCEAKAASLARLRRDQASVLKVVLAINATMFLVEGVAGWLARSTSLLGDALDMFGDAAVYGVTLYVLDRGPLWHSRASMLKGAVMVLLGLAVLVEAAAKIAWGVAPDPFAMGSIGGMALVANVACLALLARRRRDDVNMRSAWVCSRNDIIANTAVIGAAVAVRASGSWWPDVVVGAAIASLFLASGTGVLRDSLVLLRPEQRHERNSA